MEGAGKETKASGAKTISHHLSPAHQSSASPWAMTTLKKFPPTFHFPVLMLSVMLYGMEYLFVQFGYGVLAVYPPSALPSPALLAEGQSKKQKRPRHYVSSAQQ